MNKSTKRIEWEARIEDWRASGLSKAKWCRDNGFKEHQMYYWLQKINNSASPTDQPANIDWLPVQVTDELDEPKGSVLIHIDRFSVEVQSGSDIGLLSKIIHVIQS
ncbi:IS66 family insertion sequence element accessory protein TnpB [Amphibacillus sp. MSJ-3]|uniref:IS66 family insertion sequence element accessory protein TnpA n=1 Tax=Amphibacillus sp. MSJ-3 TaxID=2841505 RepID=UPI001C0F0EE4|nr:IS66 family insertion sequence element accessory protein TnpB [Amphibacillus sp. MSJ-3]MBU5593903.1 IS66 family insertion sequence element accessory protein TnpB [Amphibacillus sp. MSJ-3]